MELPSRKSWQRQSCLLDACFKRRTRPAFSFVLLADMRATLILFNALPQLNSLPDKSSSVSTPALDVFGKYYIVEGPTGTIDLYERGKKLVARIAPDEP